MYKACFASIKFELFFSCFIYNAFKRDMEFIIIGQRSVEHWYWQDEKSYIYVLGFDYNGEKDMNFISSIKPCSSWQLQMPLQF